METDEDPKPNIRQAELRNPAEEGEERSKEPKGSRTLQEKLQIQQTWAHKD